MSDLEPEKFVSRFDGQPTRWSVIQRAHGESLDGSAEARQYLVMRYSPAIRRYVRAITRDEHLADEISQDVMVRLLQGDFAGADPQKGRFRDLLKVAVRNMVRNLWAKQKVRRTVDYDLDLNADSSENETDAAWTESWRDQILNLAWSQLENYQQNHEGSVAYSILKFRTDDPDCSSEELAERLSQEIGKPIRADQARQQLRRARVRFAEFLVAEVADVVNVTTPERLEDELAQLQLLERIRDVLPADWSSNPR
ncbi:RNA polymerase sigma factor [Gimesia maris]|uniref:RNA polymerase sigma factor n=1 Tax=Gimesia maris TaxID=122 RepID=UPI002420443A|nr:sigma-70 family RNA polymerase sigma factor [Gimesia maris]|tara:strand:+ start:17707 stop:18468 length:762 start_codon:yes stop_codon:yes gene_type:complete